jgi:uncharacterized protein
MQSYDYSHRQGIYEFTWESCIQLAHSLAELLSKSKIDTVVGITRAGLIPAVVIANALRCDLFPVRITRRKNDVVSYDHPTWMVDVHEAVTGKVVAVIDEIADTGETLSLVAQRVLERGASKVITCSLVSHTWAKPKPDFIGMVTDALVIFPWDKKVLVNGKWMLHPELEHALGLQGHKSSEGFELE